MREIRMIRDEAGAAKVREANRTVCGKSIVQQQFKAEVDVNTIVGRFGPGALLSRGRADLSAVYADVSGATDYSEAVALVAAVRGRFYELAPEIREQFGNDPGQLVAAASSVGLEELQRRVYPVPEPAVASPGGDQPVGEGSVPPAVPPAV